MGWATCTLALGSTLLQDASKVSQMLSELKDFTFPSPPYRMTFLLKMETPLTTTEAETGAENMSRLTSKKNVISTE